MAKTLIGSTHRLGILGGGQLGRMFIQSAINFDIHVHIMENTPSAPSSACATTYTQGDITDYDDVVNFGATMDVVTVEIENVNIEALKELERRGVRVYPQPHVLEIIKDKGLQKSFYATHAIPTSAFELVPENPSIDYLKAKIPFVQKLRTGGYDGKGVQVVSRFDQLDACFKEPSIIEELVPFEKEISIIVARNASGETAVYPSVECEFNEANLVAFLFSPAEIPTVIEQAAEKLAIEVITKLDMVGILAVEMFLTTDGQLLVNEVAPRPHNSGHHTIESNICSQFEQHLRSILNLPLGSTKMIQYGAMINLIGEPGYEGQAHYIGFEEALKHPGVHVHLYGKETTKSNRKMGHVTVTSDVLSDAKRVAHILKNSLKVISQQ